MKNLLCMLACLILFMTGCLATQERSQNPLPDRYEKLLEKTTQALDYGYGYDYKLDLGYIYNYSFSKLNAAQKEKNFADIVMKADNNEYFNFYQNVYYIYAETMYRKKKFREERDWTNYTYLKKYLIPPLKSYFTLVETYLLKKQPDIAPKLDGYKKNIQQQIERYYKNLEMWEERMIEDSY